MVDCLRRDEAPYASHLLYAHVDVLDDTKPEERTLGMSAGFAWGAWAEVCAVYEDINIVEGTLYSSGMLAGIDRAKAAGVPVQVRRLSEDLWQKFVERYPEMRKGETNRG